MVNIQLPDASLVKEYVAGNEDALAKLIKRHESKIYGFIYSKIPDRDITNDIFQDTFIKVIKTLKSNSYNEEGKFLPWVMRISHNLVVDHYRKTKKMPLFRETEEFSIPEEHKNIVRKRIEASKTDPSRLLDWEKVKSEIKL
jgi:RNA polymerase sigma-70 factor (ECF subfamily)